MDKFILRNGDKPPEITSVDGAYRSASFVHWWFSESDLYDLKLDPFNPNRKIRGSRKHLTVIAQHRENVDKIMHVCPCTRTLCPELFPNYFPVCLILCVSGSHLRSIQVLMARSFHGMTWDEAASDGEMDGGVA